MSDDPNPNLTFGSPPRRFRDQNPYAIVVSDPAPLQVQLEIAKPAALGLHDLEKLVLSKLTEQQVHFDRRIQEARAEGWEAGFEYGWSRALRTERERVIDGMQDVAGHLHRLADRLKTRREQPKSTIKKEREYMEGEGDLLEALLSTIRAIAEAEGHQARFDQPPR